MVWPFRQGEQSRVATEPTIDPAAIVRRARRLRFQVRPEAVASLAGAYHTARRGSGLTFAELRPYEPGDDVRHLDWNVTARQNRPYVRHYVEERALTLWLLVDVSASMRFGPPGRSKADRAAQAAALLAAAAIQNGDRAGLVLVSDQVEAEVAPSGGARGLARLLRALVATPARSRGSDLTVGVSEIRRPSRRGLVVVLSDFLDALPVRPWRELGRRHDVMALRVVEPREESLPPTGLIAVEGAETGGHVLFDTRSARRRALYTHAARQRREAFRAWCAEARVAGHELPTEPSPIEPLLRTFRGPRTLRGGS